MTTHATVEYLLRFHDGELSPQEIADISTHIAGCADCAAMAREMFEAETLRIFDPLAAAPEREPRRWVPWTMGALAAAAIIAFVFIPRPQPLRPQQPPHSLTHGVPWSDAVRAALSHGAIEPPPLYVATQMSPEDIRGMAAPPAQASRLLAPVGTVVDTTRPQFRWTDVHGATYSVTVIDGLAVVARSVHLASSEWTCDRDLVRGRIYSWQLRIHRGAAVEMVPLPPRPPATFAIASADASAALAAARHSTPGDHLALGVLAARAGLREEAIAELQQAAAARPADASIQALLRSVRTWPDHA